MSTYSTNFHIPDETPLSDGGKWGGDVLGRVSHRAAVSSNVAIDADSGLGNSASAYLLAVTSSADCFARTTTGLGGTYWELLVRCFNIATANFSGYALVGFSGSGGNISLFRDDLGANVPLVDPIGTWNTGETWELRATGNIIAAYRNGSFVASYDNSGDGPLQYSAAGNTGFFIGPDGGSGITTLTQYAAGPYPDTAVIPGPPPLLGRGLGR